MPTITEKIIQAHLVEGEMKRGTPIAIKIDQTLTQDATGTMAYLQLEAMGVDQVKTECSISYVDHNTLQSGFENADDHKYLQTVAAKHGVYFSRPGNGICHQVHLERFAMPYKTLLGSDSHTPTAGGMGALAMGAGGLDVACAMAGRAFHLTMPYIVNVQLTGVLQKGVSSKDVILKLLGMLSVKGGVGKVIEYSGDGLQNLSIPQRATITNMGAELGATTSIFPSDEITKEFLKKQGRVEDYMPLFADEDAIYDETYVIDLNTLEPMIAMPHSPDHVVPVSEVEGLKVDQCSIGSCTNSSYMDMMSVANILKGKTVDENVSLTISPGSKQVLNMIARNGALAEMIASGARILESTCGPCIGMGQSPITNALSLRTFNRNFYGRSGTLSAKVCLVSPETAAASAIHGYLSDPRKEEWEAIEEPKQFLIDDRCIIKPDPAHADKVEVIRGPNIKPLPINTPMEDSIQKHVLLKVEDNITTDHIMPAGAKVLPYRSNIEKISEFVFRDVKENFAGLCKEKNGGIIIAGSNYGQGSSREHAALAPMYLGVKAIIAKSFARIHHANLINFGILPLTFCDEQDFDTIDEDDILILEHLHELAPDSTLTISNQTKNTTFTVKHACSQLDIETLLAGGTLNLIKQLQHKETSE
ncbi:MAG: aconitate hydratase [Erysipelotrichaceae bacterium]|nr:aconitate hydratase [Erysipelotrichaceae bacterium]